MKKEDTFTTKQLSIIILLVVVLGVLVFLIINSSNKNKKDISEIENIIPILTEDIPIVQNSPVIETKPKVTYQNTNQNQNNSVLERQEIINEKQILVNQLIQDINNTPNGQQLAYYTNLANKGLSDMSKITDKQTNEYDSKYGIFNPYVTNQIAGIASGVEADQKMQAIYQNAVNSDLQIAYKALETNFCDLNPKITTDSNRSFCYSLFK